MLDGFEIDLLSLGDADCIVLTQWNQNWPHRILIDGGRASDAQEIRRFLLSRGYTDFWAVLCTHAHADHAGGLIEIVRDPAFTFHNAYVHNIRQHVNGEVLRRAAAGAAPDAQAVKEVIATTDQLLAAFKLRGLTAIEPFAGTAIAGYPGVVVLGPTETYYERILTEFAGSSTFFLPSRLAVPSPLAPRTRFQRPISLANLDVPLAFPSRLRGVLANSSVPVNPKTQPFNNTSTILGVSFLGRQALLTADAGADALIQVPATWSNLECLQVPHHGSEGNLSQALIERFSPRFALIAAVGDESHPSRSIVSGLVKVGAQVASTHNNGHLWYWIGNVPLRPDYGAAKLLKGTGNPIPIPLSSAFWGNVYRP